jgi:methylated-DNA-[protein]-cysteine S-methyltransferase
MEGKMKTKVVQWKLNSDIGPLFLVASEKGLRGLCWKKQAVPMALVPSESKILITTIKQVEEYLAGSRQKFSIPLDLQGTEFQKKVWQELLQIPFGKTKSYKEIAVLIQNEKAVRAVGTANGRNPISLIIPCHRVIGSNGTLTGYAGGLKIKEKLLKLEGVI